MKNAWSFGLLSANSAEMTHCAGLIFAVGAFALSSMLQAERLPILTEKPWEGIWMGYEERQFDYGVGGKGLAEIYPKERKKDGMARISVFRTIKVNFVFEEEVNGKWQKRSIEEDEFETAQKASKDEKKFEFFAKYKGGHRVKVVHELSGKEIKISLPEVIAGGTNPVRAGIEVIFPDLYRLSADTSARELKQKMRSDEVRAVGMDGKRHKFGLYEEVKLSDAGILEQGAAAFSLKSQNLADLQIGLQSEVLKTGRIVFTQKGRLHEEFSATWYPVVAAQGQKVPRLVIQVK